MKNPVILKICLFFLSLSLIVMTGCDSDSAGESAPWSVVYPSNGQIDVENNVTFKLKYKANLDTSIDDEQIQIDGYSISTTKMVIFFVHTINSTNSAITISGDTITFNMNDGEELTSGRIYKNLVISGCKDSEGNTIDSYIIENYEFTIPSL